MNVTVKRDWRGEVSWLATERFLDTRLLLAQSQGWTHRRGYELVNMSQ